MARDCAGFLERIKLGSASPSSDAGAIVKLEQQHREVQEARVRAEAEANVLRRSKFCMFRCFFDNVHLS